MDHIQIWTIGLSTKYMYKEYHSVCSIVGIGTLPPMEEYGATVRMEPLPCLACQLPVWCSDLTDVVTLGTQQ